MIAARIALLISALLLSANAAVAQQIPENPNLPRIELPKAPEIDWNLMLTDFKGDDAAKQQAAAKVFQESGARGYSELAVLLKHENKEVVKRTKDLRDQIEQRSQEIFRLAIELHNKMQLEPQSPENFKKLENEWLTAAAYVVRQDTKQTCFQQALAAKTNLQNYERTVKQLGEIDKLINALKPEQGVERCAILYSRADLQNNLQRFADAVKSTEEIAATDKTGRFIPRALKLQASLRMRLNDAEKGMADCRRLIREFPRSVEIKAAYQLLIEQLELEMKYDEAMTETRQFVAAFPADEDAQDAVETLLTNLIEEHDFTRIAAYSDWMQKTLPIDRQPVDVYKYGGAAYEYLKKDFDRAAEAYKVLLEKYTDDMEPEHLEAALRRLQAKKAGTFPKEPADTDAGHAGLLAKFIKAVRTRDSKTLKSLIPKEDVAKYTPILDQSGGEFVTNMIVADFIIKEIKAPEGASEATVIFDFYNFFADKPAELEQTLVKEDGEWKVRWEIEEE